MRLVVMRLRRAPGLDEGLVDLRFEPGLNVVFGPNESGKSTVARAIQSTLWPQGKREGVLVDVETEWQEDGHAWSARYDGETVWTRESELGAPPALPDAQNSPAYRLHLRDLIAEVGEGHDDFAQRVRSALDGGYDLLRHATEQRTRRHGGKEKKELVEAERVLREIEGRRADLARREDDLGRLEADKQAADAAMREGVLLARVQSWLAAKAQLDEARATLSADTTPDLMGHEEDDLRTRDRALAECADDRTALEEELREARGEVSTADLPDDIPADHVVSSWLDEARELVERERALHDANAAVAVAVEHEARTRAALHGAGPVENDEHVPAILVPPVAEPPSLEPPSLEEVESLAGWLDLRSRHDDARRAVEARRALLGEEEDQAEAAAAALGEEEFIQARGHVARHLRTGPGLVWPIAGATLAGCAVAAALWRNWVPLGEWPGEGLVVVATLVGGTLCAVIGRWLGRRRYRSALGELRFSDEEVADDPASLFDEIDVRLRSVQRAAERSQERERLDAELREIDARAPALDARRLDLVDRLGIDPGADDLTVVELARRVQSHRAAADTLADERTKQAQAEKGFKAAREQLFRGVAPYLASPPETVPQAIRAVEDLQERIKTVGRARVRIGRCETRFGELDERRDEHATGRAELLERLVLHGLDDASALEQLRAWTEALPDRRAKQKAVDEAAAVVTARTRELEGHDDLLALDPLEIERRHELAREHADRAAGLSEEIGAVRREVLLAEGQDDVEVALARVGEARSALEARRTEIFEGVAAKLLLEDVSEQIGTRQRPEVLSRATDLFGLFTRHRYELEVEHHGDKARFVARATESNERKRLDQLSDGTRMQLLLAARLAFVHEGERGVHPPLVLDEALSSSDSTRMAAMTDALVAEAGTDRQIFYMTNDSGDVRDWEAACKRAGAPAPNVVRLGEVQRDEHAALWDGFEPPALRAPVASPGSLTAAQYAAKLGVPAPDPWGDLGRLHLFHLLADDLETLHRVLAEGQVELFGHFESRRRSGVASTLLGDEVIERIGFRALVAERFFAVWRKGHGRRLRRGDLEACEALSDDYKQRLSDVADEVGGDAEALTARIVENRDERVKRLNKTRRAGLDEYLHEHGFLGSEAPLGDDELVTEVSARLGEGLFGLDRDTAHARLREAESLVRLWAGLLQHGGDAA